MNTKSKVNLFRKDKSIKKNFRIKLLIEALLFISIGMSLTLFLNSIPNTIIFKDFTNDIWIGLYAGFSQIFESFILLAKACSVLLLIFLSFLLLISGIIRLLKFFSILNISSAANSKRMLYRKRR